MDVRIPPVGNEVCIQQKSVDVKPCMQTGYKNENATCPAANALYDACNHKHQMQMDIGKSTISQMPAIRLCPIVCD